MESCIFCKIVKGEILAYKVYEDELFLAFLDISQIVDGHTLLIPKKHVRWVWDVDEIGKFYEAAKKIARNIQRKTNNDFISSVTLGIMVPHAHLHLLPAENKGNLDLVFDAWSEARGRRKLKEKQMEEIRLKYSMILDE